MDYPLQCCQNSAVVTKRMIVSLPLTESCSKRKGAVLRFKAQRINDESNAGVVPTLCIVKSKKVESGVFVKGKSFFPTIIES